jgi:threonine/homoserine/homoserine lactone efflux protein
MAAAMNEGRRSALILALGVVSGSVFWGLLAAFGLSAVLSSCSGALIAMKLLGGVYLLYLGVRSAKSALNVAKPELAVGDNKDRAMIAGHYQRIYLRGAAMHLTNPKAIFVWLSIVSLALPAHAQSRDALLVVAGCGVLGLIVFCGYALLFSTARARRIYQILRRWFEGVLAVLFGYAGLRMISSVG